jgi:hypothetical protein
MPDPDCRTCPATSTGITRLGILSLMIVSLLLTLNARAEAHELDDYFNIIESGRCVAGIAKIDHSSNFPGGKFEAQTKSKVRNNVQGVWYCWNMDVPAGQIKTQLQTYVRVGTADHFCWSSGPTYNKSTTYEHRVRTGEESEAPCTASGKTNLIRSRGLNQVKIGGNWIGGYTMTPAHRLPS